MQTPWFFIKDQVKSFLLQCVLVPLIAGGLVAVIKWGGAYFYIYAWLFVLVVSLVCHEMFTVLGVMNACSYFLSGGHFCLP